MGWLTFAVAGGVIAVPIIIHLFNRTRYRRIDWAAMEFLLNAFRKTRKRMRFENLLLLLLRVMAMAFLAFAFVPQGVAEAAKWFLDGTGLSLTQGTNASRSQHLVLVLDDSASMRYRKLSKTNYELAIEAATAQLSRLNESRDRVTVISASAVELSPDAQLSDQENLQRLNRDIPVVDVKKAKGILAQARASYGAASMLPALREAGRRIAGIDSQREVARLAIVSDFQENTWSFAHTESKEHQSFVTLMNEVGEELKKHGTRMAILTVGAPAAKNRAILDVRLDNPVVGVGIGNSIDVTVGNFGSGDQFPKNLKLQYRIDHGEPRPFGENIEVDPGKTSTIPQVLPPFTAAGGHTIEIEFEDKDKDSLEEDNSRSLALNVIDELPILIINGAESDDIAKDEAAYLKYALDINEGEGDEGGRITPNRVSVVPVRLLSTDRIYDYPLVIVANVNFGKLGDIGANLAATLRSYVYDVGGAVIVTLGDNVNADDYNRLLWNEGKGVLPVQLTIVKGSGDEEGLAARFRTISGVDLNPGSPMEMFGEHDTYRLLLENPQVIRKWYGVNLDPAAAREDVPPARVILGVLDGESARDPDPLMIVRSMGRGRSMLWTTTADGDWNSLWESNSQGLPLWIFHEAATHMASGQSVSQNLTIGGHFVRMLTQNEQTGRGTVIETPAGSADKPVEVALPDGRRRLVYSRTALPGIYRLKFLATGEDNAEIVAREELFSVGLPPGECDVIRLGGSVGTKGDPEKSLRDALRNVEFVFEEREGEGTETAGLIAPADRMDLWLLFTGLAVCCLLAEMGASVWFGRRSQ